MSGKIIDIYGNIIGTHRGIHKFTIGQRKGINCPKIDPYYVIKIDNKHNKVVVGHKKSLYSSSCKVRNINWIPQKPKKRIQLKIKTRYKQQPFLATVIPLNNNYATLYFNKPQLAITPGQAAVFYNSDKVVGSGWIDGQHFMNRRLKINEDI